MTPTQIETRARSKYNAIGDSYFSQEEILDFIYQGCIELAQDALVIEATPQSTSTVIGQRSYAYPTNAVSIKRITYEGKKLKKINFREDDIITGLNQSTADQGTPQYYSIWNDVIYLRPIPAAVGTLVIYSYKEPSTITITSTIEIPTRYHMSLVDFAVKEMALKDSNVNVADRLQARWDKFVLKAKASERKKERGDSFSAVQDEEMMSEGFFGIV